MGDGTGQGLANAWETIVNHLGGSIQLVMNTNEETTMQIQIPLEKNSIPFADDAKEAETSRQKILFVDDEKMVLNGLRRMLLGLTRQWDMRFVNSGAEALEELSQSDFDVIVTDMRMPNMNGLELLQHVKERYPHVLRFVLSGQTDLEASLRSAGPAHQFLNKPCDAEKLKGTIDRTCRMRNLLEQESLKKIVAGLDDLPSVPKLYREVERLLQQGECSLDEVSKLIRQDAAMTIKILQVVNSGFYGLSRSIRDVHEAIVLLGTETIRSIILSASLFLQFEKTKIGGYSIDALARNSFHVAGLAKKIALHEGQDEEFVENCFLAGVVHNIGQLVLAANCEKQFTQAIEISNEKKIPLYRAEREVFGSSHAEVGAYLLGLWGVSFSVVEAVAYHHSPWKCLPVQMSPLTMLYSSIGLLREDVEQIKLYHSLPIDEFYLEKCGLLERLPVWRASSSVIEMAESNS